MNIPAFLRDADMDLLDKLGTCQTTEELDKMLSAEGVEHSASDLGPLFAALTPMRSPASADDMFKNFSSADFEKMTSKLQSMMSGMQGGKQGTAQGKKTASKPSGATNAAGTAGMNSASLNDLLTFLSNNKEK